MYIIGIEVIEINLDLFLYIIPHTYYSCFEPVQCLHGLGCICLGPFKQCDHGFKSHSRHTCMSIFFGLYYPIVLVMGQSPLHGDLPKCLIGFILSELIMNWNRSESLTHETNTFISKSMSQETNYLIHANILQIHKTISLFY
jgi:hypothetical protein